MAFGIGQQIWWHLDQRFKSLRFIKNWGTLCQLFPLNSYVHPKHTSKVHISAAAGWIYEEIFLNLIHGRTPVPVMMNTWWLFGFHYRRLIVVNNLLTDIWRNQRCPKAQDIFYWLNRSLTDSFCTMERERDGTNFVSRFFSRETPWSITSSTFKFPSEELWTTFSVMCVLSSYGVDTLDDH